MNIKMNTTVSGPGIFFARNMVYDLPEKQAKALIAARFAAADDSESTEPATPATKREKAIRQPSETR
jgi:hypothetical protein